jgi:hypothetical protein
MRVHPPSDALFENAEVDDSPIAVEFLCNAGDLGCVSMPVIGATLALVLRDAMHRVPLNPSCACDHVMETKLEILNLRGKYYLPKWSRIC